MARKFVAEQTYEFAAPPRKVFDALTKPRELVKWFLSGATLAPKRNGRFAFDWHGGYHMESKVLQFRSGTSVSFHWVDWLPTGKKAKTEASFRVTHRGRRTFLRLRHSGFKDPEHFAECSSRWAYYLTNMKSVLDHGIDLRSKGDW